MAYFKTDTFIDILVLVLHHNSGEVYDLVTQYLTAYEEEIKSGTSIDSESNEMYIHLIKQVMNIGTVHGSKAGLDAYLLKLKDHPVMLKDPELYSTLRGVFSDNETLDASRYKYITSRIHNTLVWNSNNKFMKKLYGKVIQSGTTEDEEKKHSLLLDMNSLCNEIVNMNTNHLNRDESSAESPTVARFVDFNDTDTIRKALEVFKLVNDTYVYRTGWQGLNRALGGEGVRMGESITFNAPSHHAKSLIMTKAVRWCVTYNKAPKEFAKPTCILYSLENETPYNLRAIFDEMYINKYKELPPKDISNDDIIDFCKARFEKSGWRLIIHRHVGTDFGADEFIADFNRYKQDGYNVLFVVVDYINKMRKGASAKDSNHLAVRELYDRLVNFTKVNNCTLVTAHQLNRDAVNIIKNNPTRAVERLGVEHLADATDPQREIDCSFFMCLEKNQHGDKYLTLRMDKHRYDNGKTPDGHKCFAYKFDGELGILDDIFGEDMSTRDIYASKGRKGSSVEDAIDLY